ncbi:PIR protein [Plasmodium yoelii]|uniref:PIR protein n=3 Tax=Plasmodium yoelii TaxID=5861 RepID=A0AAF0B204_PLAYO|nr:PIR protein [Plasmodium yoelii]EAA19043.1 putative bir1 protein [Plasmodium yoelii yoelii]WBY54404.1 PIR protein [Plasmodium yoelii yoelii]CDS44966.1 YIR protein [Plasmodium yoelii]VTZ71423.1 PIR protein [Plasmodium yoelii]|eukprot:XP_034493327.1 PIR protein [Plasmodium yoelii]
MNRQMCEKFQEVRNSLPDQLNSSGYYQFKDEEFLNNYCNSNQCQSDYDRISAGCLYLLDQLYKDSGVLPSPKDSNPYIVDYILIWLSYMLNLTNSKGDNIKSFYSAYINSCDKYKTEISELKDHDNYKDLIDKRKEFLYMDSNIVSKFYEAFKLLCNLYNELDYEKKNCKNYLEDNNEFFKKSEELKKDTSITGNDSYNQLLSTLSTDYNDFKKECKEILSPPPKETKDNPGQTLVGISGQGIDDLGQNVHSSEQYFAQDSGQDAHNSDVALSSSSIVSKLIPVLLIFGAIPIFLGISYKYSLFGFRKRFQKQKLREKLKK